MGSIKNAFKFIFSPTASRTTGILIILVIAAAVPLTVLVAQKQQELRQHAQNTQQVSVSTQACMPPFNAFVGKYCSADLALQNAQNDPENFNLKIVESSNAILPEDLTLCNNGKDPVYYVYEKGKQGNACVATDPASGSSFSGTCNDGGNCDGTITVVPTPKPPIVGDYPTPKPPIVGPDTTCDSPNGSVRTIGSNQYVCSSQKPPAGSNCESVVNLNCVNPSDVCYVCPIVGAAPTVSSSIPTVTPISTATIAPAAPPAGQQTAPPPAQAPATGNLHAVGDANGDGHINKADYDMCLNSFNKTGTGDSRCDFNGKDGVNIIDYNIWLYSYTKKVAP